MGPQAPGTETSGAERRSTAMVMPTVMAPPQSHSPGWSRARCGARWHLGHWQLPQSARGGASGSRAPPARATKEDLLVLRWERLPGRDVEVVVVHAVVAVLRCRWGFAMRAELTAHLGGR